MKFIIITLVMTVASCNFAHSQELHKIFGWVAPEDFRINSALIDSNTNAVFIADVGTIEFEGSRGHNWVGYVFRKHTRIKILNKKAIHLADIIVRLYGKNLDQDRIDSLQATTYNLVDGRVVATRLENADVYDDKLNDFKLDRRFAMPGIKDGSIIDFSYVVHSSHEAWLPEWSFQHMDGPTLHSEFEITIPNMLAYLFISHGADSFAVKETEKLRRLTYRMASVNVTTDGVRHHWVMKNLAQFKAEDYILSPTSYLDKIEFHLSQYYNGEDIHNLSNNWKLVTENLLQDEHFGYAINKEGGSFLSDYVKKITPENKTPIEQVEAIYDHVKKTYQSTGDHDIYVQTSLMSVYNKKKGSDAEINLLLIAMLKQKGFIADPVILGTRDQGPNSAEYPLMGNINHVVCAVWLAGDTLFLDASKPNAGFGRLPIECYNGHARIISETNSGSVYFYPDRIKEQEMTTVFISNGSDKKITGTWEQIPGLYRSDELRKQIKKQGESKFFDFARIYYGSEAKIANTEIDSLNQPNFPLRLYYEFNELGASDGDRIYFSPLEGFMDQNPFKAESRRFPVELNYPPNNMFVLNMEIPAGYTVDEIPQSVKVNFNGNEGFFEYLIAKDENNIQLRAHLKIMRATFSPDEYSNLRDFFAYVAKKQSEQIIFKKKK